MVDRSLPFLEHCGLTFGICLRRDSLSLVDRSVSLGNLDAMDEGDLDTSYPALCIFSLLDSIPRVRALQYMEEMPLPRISAISLA